MGGDGRVGRQAPGRETVTATKQLVLRYTAGAAAGSAHLRQQRLIGAQQQRSVGSREKRDGTVSLANVFGYCSPSLDLRGTSRRSGLVVARARECGSWEVSVIGRTYGWPPTFRGGFGDGSTTASAALRLRRVDDALGHESAAVVSWPGPRTRRCGPERGVTLRAGLHSALYHRRQLTFAELRRERVRDFLAAGRMKAQTPNIDCRSSGRCWCTRPRTH